MKVSFALSALLAAEVAVASSWFSKAAYNKWHETELERWLSDHDVPYPTPADRKDLENLVKSKWADAVESPYVNWDVGQLQKQLEAQGTQIKKGSEKNKDYLVSQVKSSWADTTDTANTAYGNVKDWIFDSWTDSQLKAFCDKHGIPVPQPRKRDVLLKTVRENYQTAANKAGEAAAYPGNWIYSAWSDSDLKAWLDARGVPVPQPSSRDKVIAAIRRNARYASLNAQSAAEKAAASASASAGSAKDTVSEAIFDAWSDSEIKAWADKNGIKVPQGSTRNQLLAIARKNAAKLTGDNLSYQAGASGSSASSKASASASSAAKQASSSASSAASVASSKGSTAYGAASSKAGNEYAKATEDASIKAQDIGNQIYSNILYYVDEAQIALGLKTNYVSSASRSAASASKSAASAYAKASKGVKGEL